jgi:hypothetical protein
MQTETEQKWDTETVYATLITSDYDDCEEYDHVYCTHHTSVDLDGDGSHSINVTCRHLFTEGELVCLRRRKDIADNRYPVWEIVEGEPESSPS